MKIAVLFIKCILMMVQLNAQINEQCLPKMLIVAAENLNFRSGPDTNTIVLAVLTNSEPLALIELQSTSGTIYWNSVDVSWLRVKRIRTGEIGYVYGKHVKAAEMAYLVYYDCDRVQSGNWYSIFPDEGKIKMERTIPVISEFDKGFKSITGSKSEYEILICSQDELEVGEIDGILFENTITNLQFGTELQLLKIKDVEFSLICIGGDLVNTHNSGQRDERIIFQTAKVNGLEKSYLHQDLSDCISKFGEGGYHVHFAGDINNDGIPELIFSEGTNNGSAVYYFKSNTEGKLELQSITGSTSKC
jgi:Bacterial SH3 domain